MSSIDDASDDAHDLGLRYRQRKSGELEVLHHGRVAATLRGGELQAFLVHLERCSPQTRSN